ncbi:zinc ribbon domain-containing protein, partial [Paracoccus kondratievae]|uniref:zinc ribbon domain-containing protein n=1 Tax=Paracoccus kondratievae TaxID=135740 RepID=UPI0022F2662A
MQHNCHAPRQGELAFSTRSRPEGNPLNDRRRPKHLFAGLVKCGCLGGYSMISKDLLGCSTARNKGTCDNRINIRRDALEASVLNGLRKHLMEPALFREFCTEFTREVNRLRIERGADREVARRELDKISRQISQIIEAITDGMYHPSMKEKMTGLEARKAELTEKLANANEPPPLLHPNMAALYAQRIAELTESLQHEDSRAQAAEILRSLVDQVTLVPEDGELAIVLHGDLGAILRFAAGRQNPDFLSEAEALDNLLAQSGGSRQPGRRNAKTSALCATEVSQLSLVAGVGFEPTT